jgi:hypothetical protein
VRTVAALEREISDANTTTRELRDEGIEQHKRTSELAQQLAAANARLTTLEGQLAQKPSGASGREGVKGTFVPHGTTQSSSHGAQGPSGGGSGTGFGHACAGPGDPSCNL